MPGETDVINLALREVGASRIISRTDGTKSANVADDIYDTTRDTLLRSHPWNFATFREKLAKVTAAPEFEYDNAFAYPFDWIRTVSVHNNDGGKNTFDYRSEFQDSQRVIVTSSDEVWMRYIYRATDPNFMTSDFIEALVKTLASKFSIPLTSSKSLRDDMNIEARRWLHIARSSDALGSTPERRPPGSWATARGGNRGGADWHHNH